MSCEGAGERPNTKAVLGRLKGFQRDTVEYAFERLYLAPDSTRRFLVADEVGLGKTIVARGVIAKAIDHLWDGARKVERIDIVYICSNDQIARQNVRRLQIANSKFLGPDRLTLLPREIRRLRENRVNYLAFTPNTSLNHKSSLGRQDERVLLYHLVQRVWPDRRTGPMNVFQGKVKNKKDFRSKLKEFKRQQHIDADLAKAFERSLLDEGEDLGRQYRCLCERFQRFRTRVTGDDRRRQAAFIGRLRLMLAEVCVTALQPDLVILDEFQRFNQLLDGRDATAKLAKRLFSYSDQTSDVRLLLLSATPYRMYTLHHEKQEDDHYRDFLRTMEFLDPELKQSGALHRLLDDYRQAMYRIERDTEALKRIKGEIEMRLRRVMSRTERLRASSDVRGMLLEVPCRDLQLTAGDVGDFLALEKIGREVRQPNVIEYWKSAPYLLSFMDDYKFKAEVVSKLDSWSGTDLQELLTNEGRLSLSWKEIETYAYLDPANARLRNVIEWMERSEVWKLLWLPPSLPYYAQSGSWKTGCEEQLSKRLIFSNWQVVPKAVSSVLSYDVERRIIQRFDDSIRNTPEARRRRQPLLRFASSNDRLTGMPVLGILYPSPSLAELGDPVPVPDGGTTLDQALAHALARLEPHLERIAEQYLHGEREDDRWYWVAPILLDLERYGKATKEWFGRWGLPNLWTGAQKDEDKDSRWVDHVKEAEKFVKAKADRTVRTPPDLGRPPQDLAEVLATRSLAGPATCSLRALTRASGPAARATIAARDCAARIAWSFRTLFNRPEAMALVRGESASEGAPYWIQVEDYCAAGNLQAVLDEYVHILRDIEGLFDTDEEESWVKLAESVSDALSLRTGTSRVDEIQPTEGAPRIQSRRLRNHFAMRFGTQERDDGKTAAHEEQVRRAFNSPFWPFVLSSTSIGQQGLDFHAYCHSVVHWNLPSNPVDLEQREGRIHRYKGHAVRKNVAAKHGGFTLNVGSTNVWDSLFEVALDQSPNEDGLVPFWLFPVPDGAHIERHVPALPLSRDANQLVSLKRSLAIYRMIFGQPRQDDLLAFLLERFKAEDLHDLEVLLRIDLSPKKAPN